MSTLTIQEKTNILNLIDKNNEVINLNLKIMNEINHENFLKFLWHTKKFNKASEIVKNKVVENQIYINSLY
jgi:hypothetical protein